LKGECDALLFDEPPGLLDGLGRAVAIIKADEVELAAVDPAPLVDHLETRGLGSGDRDVARSGSAVGKGLADLDLGVRDAGRVSGPGDANSGSRGDGGARPLDGCRPTAHDEVDRIGVFRAGRRFRFRPDEFIA
jgi:hypothetical protein